jgi:hypothetical protein
VAKFVLVLHSLNLHTILLLLTLIMKHLEASGEYLTIYVGQSHNFHVYWLQLLLEYMLHEFGQMVGFVMLPINLFGYIISVIYIKPPFFLKNWGLSG